MTFQKLVVCLTRLKNRKLKNEDELVENYKSMHEKW